MIWYVFIFIIICYELILIYFVQNEISKILERRARFESQKENDSKSKNFTTKKNKLRNQNDNNKNNNDLNIFDSWCTKRKYNKSIKSKISITANAEIAQLIDWSERRVVGTSTKVEKDFFR